MRKNILVFVFHLYIIFLSAKNVENYLNNSWSAVISYKSGSFNNYHPDRHVIKNVGIFLLASLSNAVELGEKEPDKDYINYFQRLVAAKQTWASRAHVFFGVTGQGSAESRALRNQTACRNQTLHFYELMNRPSYEFHVYNCTGDIRILHFPYCNGESFGAQGPCCRCNGAMKFFLDLYQAHRRGSFPQWFVFSDDDYYMRLEYLEAVLAAPSLDPFDAYSLRPYEGDKFFGYPGYGMSIFNHNCSVPCIHRHGWMGWGGLSIGALIKLHSSLRANELVNLCSQWGITHDIGFGLYTYLQALPAVQIIQNMQDIWDADFIPPEIKSILEPAIYHINHRISNWGSYSEIFGHIWEKASKGNSTQHFDHEIFYNFERRNGELSRQYIKTFKMTGIKNSIKYRKWRLLEDLLSQIQYNNSKQNPIRLVYYSSADCNDDKLLFDSWLSQLSQEYHYQNLIFPLEEPSLCLKYSHFMSKVITMNNISDLLRDIF